MTNDTVALVTGANKGIGTETVRQLARLGAGVFLGSRELARGEAAAEQLRAEGLSVTPIRLDVTDSASVHAASARLEADCGRLDILVNNAGTLVAGPAAALTADQIRETFEVNVFGVVTAVRTLLPLLRQSCSARIVNVSSNTGSLGLTSDGTEFGTAADQRLAAYAVSKGALNMLTLQYARAFVQDPALSHIKINSAAPGFTATDLNQHRGTRTVEEAARIIVELATLPEDGPAGGFFNDQGVVPW